MYHQGKNARHRSAWLHCFVFFPRDIHTCMYEFPNAHLKMRIKGFWKNFDNLTVKKEN